MCLPTDIKIQNDSIRREKTLQEEKQEMERIQNQLRTLIGFNPVNVNSRYPRKRARSTESKAAAVSKPAPSPAEKNEWVLWQHKLIETFCVDGKNQHHGLQEWQDETSEVAHFFRSTKHSCDLAHVPSPSNTFTRPIPKHLRYKNGPLLKHASGPKIGYSLFRQGISAEWEDPKNANGGSWFVRQYIEPCVLDRFWKNLVAGLVDQKTPSSSRRNAWKPKHKRSPMAATSATNNILDHVNGIRVDDKTRRDSQRAMYKIEIWLDTTDRKIRDQVREWMLDTMFDGRLPLRPVRTHWKGFSDKIRNQTQVVEADEQSQATSTTDSCDSSTSSF